MEDNNKASIIFQISGGNNVIAPNATTATQNILNAEKLSGDSGIRK